MSSIHDAIAQTQCWLDSLIINHNLCPFAKRERDRGSIRFYLDENGDMNQVLETLIRECERLEQEEKIETTLFILTNICQNFNDYLDFLDIANQLMATLGYKGIFQLASFHPDYCFADNNEDDPANYTNRSPFPMLHIIREQSLEKALKNYPAPELIPRRNIEFCRDQGLEKMQQILAKCTGGKKE